MRIAFASCYQDPWIDPISRDLYNASEALGHEFLYIGAGKNAYLDKNYLDLNKFFLDRTSILNSLGEENIALEMLIDREITFLEKLSGKNTTNRDEIKRKLYSWFAEAIALLKIIQPDLLMVWNGLLEKRAIYAKASTFLHIPVHYAEKGMLPDSWFVDPKGINALSSLAESKSTFKTSEENLQKFKMSLDRIDKKGESAWEQPSRKSTSILKKRLNVKNQRIVFFPGQVSSDSNIILFSKNFKDTLDALKWIVKGINKENFFILVKPHPKGKLTEKECNKVIDGKGKAILDINVLDAIEIADCIVSINSTVAFEATIRAKPVVLLGQGILSNKEFVSEYVPEKNSDFQISECIKRYDERKDYLYKKALSFAYYLNSEYYTYRKNHLKTVDLIKRATKGINGKTEKVFSCEEVMAFFPEISYQRIKKSCGIKILSKALFEKIKEKLIIL